MSGGVRVRFGFGFGVRVRVRVRVRTWVRGVRGVRVMVRVRFAFLHRYCRFRGIMQA